jgi:hypothetical protein
MRRQFYFLGVFVILLQFSAQASLLSSRGFFANSCYGHVAKIVRENRSCYLELFSESKSRLSFSIDKCPDKSAYKRPIYARFKLLENNHKITAHLIGWAVTDLKVGNTLEAVSNGLAQPARCD